MKKHVVFLTFFVLFMVSVGVLATAPGNAIAAGKTSMALQPMTGLLLVPDSENHRVMGFDPMTGNLVDPNVIHSDPTHLTKPAHAILSADGNSILVSDTSLNVVQQYNLAGNYLGVFAPKGGADTSILASPAGMALRPNGNLLVTVQFGPNINAIAEFDTDGNYLGNFIENGAGGLSSPFFILYRPSHEDYLVTGAGSDTIHRYDLNGSPLGDLTTEISKPLQIVELANGNLLVSSVPGGWIIIRELTSSGSLVDTCVPEPTTSGWGAYELSNGNILVTAGSEVRETAWSDDTVEIKAEDTHGGFIQYVQVLSKTGFWVVPGQIGSAISIEVQGNKLAIGWGAYDEDTGEPIWLFSSGEMPTASAYSGVLYKYGGGSCFTCDYSEPTKQQSVGSISITFTSNTTAIITALGVIKNIQRSVF